MRLTCTVSIRNFVVSDKVDAEINGQCRCEQGEQFKFVQVRFAIRLSQFQHRDAKGKEHQSYEGLED